MSADQYDVHCRECGLPLRRLGDGSWMHRKGGAVAACDLDSDHAALPDAPEPPPRDGAAGV